MPTLRRRAFYRRRFLNPAHHHAGAYVIAEVETVIQEWQQNGSPRFDDRVEVTLTISDCARVIHLDFDSYTAAERRASLYKINLLVDTLARVRDAMDAEYAALTERHRQRALRQRRERRRRRTSA